MPGSKSVEGFSAYDKVDKSKSFYECESTCSVRLIKLTFKKKY